MKNSYTLSPTLRTCTTVLLLILVFACKKADDTPVPINSEEQEQPEGNEQKSLPSIVELATSVDNLSILVDAIGASDPDILETLDTDTPKTVFAPSNLAFLNLLSQLEDYTDLDDFDEESEKQLLAEIVKYHVVEGKRLSNALTDGMTLTTLQSEELVVTVDADIFLKDKTDDLAKVIYADNEASNGVVHIVDKILLPDEVLQQLFPQPTVAGLVSATENLSQLEAALQKAGLSDTFDQSGDYTVFAPTDAAIDELFELLGEGYTSFDDFDNFLELEVLKKILMYHVVPETLLASELSPGSVMTLLEGNTIELLSNGGTFAIGDASDTNAQLLEVDLQASNGVVHIIDKILIPQELVDLIGAPDTTGSKTIKELVEENPEFSFLKTALEITDLLPVLGEAGPYTVFAPQNEVFTALFPLFGESVSSMADFDTSTEIALLRDLLLYHVLPGSLWSSNFSVSYLTTLSGENRLELIGRPSGFALLDATGLEANFIASDIPASNGVVHVVDRLLVPSSVIQTLSSATMQLLDFLGTAAENTDFSEALRMLRMLGAGLNDLWQDEYTFFLPTNAAFLSLFEVLPAYDSLRDFRTAEDLRLLTEIVSYHLITQEAFMASDLGNGQILTTSQGEVLEVLVGASVHIKDKSGELAQVIATDTELGNGIVHVLDKVLLPEAVLSQL